MQGERAPVSFIREHDEARGVTPVLSGAVARDRPLLDWRGSACGFAVRTLGVLERGHPLSVLIFHRVLASIDPFYWGDSTASEFEVTMMFLAQHFNVVPLREGLARLASHSLPPRAVALTFDDGYADNLLIAQPILTRLGLPATVFVATGYCAGDWMWNDRVIECVRRTTRALVAARPGRYPALALTDQASRTHAAQTVIEAIRRVPGEERAVIVASLQEELDVELRAGPMMSTDDLRRIRMAGWDIGAHTVNHPILSTIQEARARAEIVESRRFLVEALREPIDLFAYPNGKPGVDYTPVHVAMVRSAGFSAAVNTRMAAVRRDDDRYELPRFTPWDRQPARFALRLAASRVALRA
jgi:peptidoglycan/xylan/chitin deacetylase (PgdA/CDA1 family)